MNAIYLIAGHHAHPNLNRLAPACDRKRCTLITSAHGGGVEKMAILLANEFSMRDMRGIMVHLVLETVEGPNLHSLLVQ